MFRLHRSASYRSHSTFCFALLFSFAIVGICLALPVPTVAQTVIQSQDTNKSGVVADLVECKRKDGVLSVRIRLRNTSNGDVSVDLIRNEVYDTWYVTAKNKKYFVLKDSAGKAVAYAGTASSFGASLDKGGAFTWWAKYPAPPADIKIVNVYTPLTGPFDDVPITDQ